MLDEEILSIVRAIDVFAFAVFTRAGVVTPNNQVRAAKVFPDDTMP